MSDPTPAEALKVELLPCPFCGKPPKVCPDTSYGAATVFCPDENGCPVQPVADAELNAGETVADAITRWNIRALPTPDAGEVRTYREGVEDAAKVADKLANVPAVGHTPDEKFHNRIERTMARTIAAAIRKLP